MSDEESEMSVKEELKEQLVTEFSGADYPVDNQLDFIPTFSNGVSTKFEVDDIELTVMEISTLSGADFPYESAEEVSEDIIERLDEEEYFDNSN